MKHAVRWLAVIAFAAALFLPSLPVWAKPTAQLTVTRGMVVTLQGTPHLFVGDDQGVLHWGGDTRGLTGRFVDWTNRQDVTLDQLKTLRRGDPWLSAGLLKIGDPIYLVKWETNEPAPTLLHIQTIGDVELFGINANNYGTLVMGQSAWQQQYGVNGDTLTRGELTGAIATATPVATVTPVNRFGVRLVEVARPGTNTFRTKFEITDTPNTVIRAALVRDEYDDCDEGCSTDRSTNHDAWGPIDIGRTDNMGKLTWTDEHKAYRSSTYTFADPVGNSAAVSHGSDF